MNFRKVLRWFGVNSLLVLVFSCFAIIAIWYLYPKAVGFMVGGEWVESDGYVYYQVRGLFGDQFGALSSLFSGLAFAGIIYTILLQRSDLISTRREVERQNLMSEKQAFESTLFSMLFARQELLKDLHILDKTGKKALGLLYTKILFSDDDFPVFVAVRGLSKDTVRAINSKKSVEGYEGEFSSDADVSTVQESLVRSNPSLDTFLDSEIQAHTDKLKAAADKVVAECVEEISHYLRYTFWIYKSIDCSEILSNAEKKKYSDIVRSQMADVEVAAIFYSVMVSDYYLGWVGEPVSLEEMRALAIKYDIVLNVNDRFLIHRLHKKLVGCYL